jgi:hypothetical protein
MARWWRAVALGSVVEEPRQYLTDDGNGFSPSPRQKAEMADTHKATRQYMQQELA